MQAHGGNLEYVKATALFAASALILSAIQAPLNASAGAWVALVPFVLAACGGVRAKVLLVSAYAVGAVYWLVNVSWVMHVTPAGWAALSAYLGLYWPATALALRICRHRRVPLWLSVPVIFTGAEAVQGWLFTGFGWRFLAHSQYANTRLIQIADVFGAAGVSFLIAFVNGIIAAIAIDRQQEGRFRPSAAVKLSLGLGAIAAALAYGNHRLNEAGQCTRLGPTVAAVQSNVPQSVKESGTAGQAMLDELLAQSRSALSSHPVLVAWPETMVTAYINQDLLACLPEESEMRSFDRQIRELAAQGVYVLVGAPCAEPLVSGDKMEAGRRYNSALLYLPEGRQWELRYDKMHLVPFGEFVPFRRTIPPLYRLLMRLTPYDYEYSLTAGTRSTRFPLRAMEREFRFGVLICYEDTAPEVARRLVYDPDGAKRLDWLVNISNDGWFVRQTSGGIVPTAELAQHMAICVFRAVENRVSVLRSVNTGISVLIDPLGRIRDDMLAGSLPSAAFERQGVAGWFAARITCDSRATVFGTCGRWLDFCCAIGFVGSIIGPSVAGFARSRQRTAH